VVELLQEGGYFHERSWELLIEEAALAGHTHMLQWLFEQK